MTTTAAKPANPIWGLLFLAGLGLMVWGFWPKGAAPSAPSTNSAPVTVTYKLTGSTTGADLTYTDGSGNIQQQNGRAVPLRSTSGTEGMSFRAAHGVYLTFMAQNNYEVGDLDCAIEADGVVLNTGHSSGGYAIVTCSATVP